MLDFHQVKHLSSLKTPLTECISSVKHLLAGFISLNKSLLFHMITEQLRNICSALCVDCSKSFGCLIQ